MENVSKQIWTYAAKRNLWHERRGWFFKCLKETRGDKTNVKAFYGKFQVSFLAEVGPQVQRQLAANYTREGEGHANEGWQINKDVVSKVCTDFDDVLFWNSCEVRMSLSQNEQDGVQRPGWSLAADFSECQLSNFCRHICDCGKLLKHACARICLYSLLCKRQDPGTGLTWICLVMFVMVPNLGSRLWWFRITFSK